MTGDQHMAQGLTRLRASHTIHRLFQHLDTVRTEIATELEPGSVDDVDQALQRAERALNDAIDRIHHPTQP